jgi:hypothetical protein
MFVVEFIDSDGNLASPSSASMTISYIAGGVAASTTFDLTQNNSFWEGTWSTAGVDVPSDAVWVTFSSLTTAPAQSGTIRIIDP